MKTARIGGLHVPVSGGEVCCLLSIVRAGALVGQAAAILQLCYYLQHGAVGVPCLLTCCTV